MKVFEPLEQEKNGIWQNIFGMCQEFVLATDGAPIYTDGKIKTTASRFNIYSLNGFSRAYDPNALPGRQKCVLATDWARIYTD